MLVDDIKIKNSNKMVHPILFDYFQAQNYPYFQMKIILDGKKIHSHLNIHLKTQIKKWLKTLSLIPYQVYKMNIFYKYHGDYILSDDAKIYFYKTFDEDIHLLEQESSIFVSNEFKEVHDFSIFGRAKKKIVIESTNLNLYHVQLCCLEHEDLNEKYVHRNIYLITNDVNIPEIVGKKLNKYHFDIQNVFSRYENHVHMVDVQILMLGKKTILERMKSIFIKQGS